MNETDESLYKERVREMGRRISHLERVIKLSQVLNSTLELAPLLDIIVQVATELTGTTDASIMLIDRETGELRFKAAFGHKSAEIRPFSVPLKGSIAGTVATEDKPLLVRDAQSDPRWYHQVDEGSGFVTRSIMAVPMRVRGEVIGVLNAVNKRGDEQMTWEDVQLLTTLASQAAIAVENARLLSELQAAYDELNELDRLKSEFIAIAAHELRTPLSVILGYATFLKDDASGTAREQLDIVLHSAMRLRSLIDDMVNLREVDSGEAVLSLEYVAIQELVRTAVGEIQSIVDAKEQRLSLSLPEEPIIVQADRSKVNIVLANLLSNATRFTPNRGRLGVQAGRSDRSVWATVWDTGIGISDECVHRIFDRFYQAEPSLTRRYEGMGLGLSIAKEMVELHHGRIKVESQEGKGSAFTVTLPIEQPQAAQGSP
jgi:signal transduction histidine kinase